MIRSMSRDDFLEKVCNYVEIPEWKYSGSKPCIIDFSDEICPPCKALDPIFKKLSVKYVEKVDFYIVSVNTEAQLTQELGIKNLPTLVLCPVDDKPIVLQGMTTEKQLISKIDDELITKQ